MNLMLSTKAIFKVARAPFLLLTVIVVGLGASIAVYEHGVIDLFLLGVVFVGALAAHISVNSLNEYLDFSTGLDASTDRTPFSGGSGFLPENPQYGSFAMWLGIVTLLITISAGLYLLTIRGWGLLPFGLVGVALIVTYTPLINKQPYLCLLAPGFGFGPLMLLGTYYVLSNDISAAAFATSLIVMLLVNNLLLLNQFPDVEADRAVGRRHFPIVIGRYPSAWVYAGSTAIAFSLVALFWLAGVFPSETLWVLLIMPLAAIVTGQALRYAENLPKLSKFLGLNVALALLTPSVLALGFFVG